jgi:CheY-like chemotaxis protein
LSGLDLAITNKPDLILLDWMLPKMSGIDVCKEFRKTDSKTPIIFLTAKDTIQETIEGLKSGANDYIKKPFSFEELLERIKIHFRTIDDAKQLTLSNIKVDLSKYQVFVDDKEVSLTQREFELLVYLIKNKDPKQAVNEALNKVATDASEQSDGSLSISDLLNNLLNNFILSLPKALIMSVLSAKVFLPLIMVYKIFKQIALNVVINIKELMRKFYKAISLIVKDLFWIFIRAFWELVKIDLIAFVTKLVKKIILKKYKRYLLIITSLLALLKKISETDMDNCFAIFQTILDTITGAINMKTPLSVPSFLLFVADLAPGYSQDRAFLNIVERLESAGVPTGPIYGEDNDVLTLVKSVIDGHTEEEDANSFVQIVLKGGVLPGPTGGATIPPALISGVGKKF